MSSPAVIALAVLAWLGPPTALLVTTATLTGAATASTGACGPGGAPTTLPGPAGPLPLDTEQLAGARAIVAEVLTQHLPQRAAVIAVAVALQESSLRNLTHGDRDSLGLFQQRPSAGYDRSAALDPRRATAAFLHHLIAVPHWDTRPLTDVAADTQRPREDLRGAYARWEPTATTLVTRTWPTPTPAATPTGGASPAPAAAPSALIPDCPGTAGDGDTNPAPNAPEATTATGITLTGPAAAQTAARFALDQLGEPYVYGSEGPNSWDCSSLVQAAWAHAGTAIPRTTYNQVNAGHPIPLAQARTGDLVLIPGSTGTPTHPGHIGMIIGARGGQPILIQAPRTGDIVKLTPLTRWTNLIVAVRRIT